MGREAEQCTDTGIWECVDQCKQCQERKLSVSAHDAIDLMIWHHNGHVWPGFAGEPTGVDYGGSDF